MKGVTVEWSRLFCKISLKNQELSLIFVLKWPYEHCIAAICDGNNRFTKFSTCNAAVPKWTICVDCTQGHGQGVGIGPWILIFILSADLGWCCTSDQNVMSSMMWEQLLYCEDWAWFNFCGGHGLAMAYEGYKVGNSPPALSVNMHCVLEMTFGNQSWLF